MNNEVSELRELYNEFQTRFPLEKLSEMTLQQYTDTGNHDTFTYWLEIRTRSLGSIKGGTSYKFGIFKFNPPLKQNKRIVNDEEYAWLKNFNVANRDDAFEIVRNAVVAIADAASKGDYEAIDKIEAVDEMVKWKIAYLYSDEKVIPIFNRVYLLLLTKHYGQAFADSTPTSELQRFIMTKRGEKDIYSFGQELWDIVVGMKVKPTYWLYAPGEGASQWSRCIEESIMCIGWDEMGELTGFNNKIDVRSRLQKVYNRTDSCKNDIRAIWDFISTMKEGDIVFAKKGIGQILGKGIVKGKYVYNPQCSTYRNIRSVEWLITGEWPSNKKLPQKTLTDISDYADLLSDLEEIVNTGGTVIDCREPQHEPQYWWLTASPAIWRLSSMRVGEMQDYTLKNDNGNPRRIYQNFLDAKVGDKVIGYEATPRKSIVALAEVAIEQDGEKIVFRKTESLLNPIDLTEFKNVPELSQMQWIKNPNGSFFRLTKEEYEFLLDLIRQTNSVQRVDDKILPVYTKEDFLKEVFMSESDYDKLSSLLLRKKNIILQGAPGVGKTFTAKRLAFSLMGVTDNSRVESVQFHQNFSYEDFIMGFKPNSEGGFRLETGIFFDFCRRAANDKDRDYFFIIDEINRGNLSKIWDTAKLPWMNFSDSAKNA